MEGLIDWHENGDGLARRQGMGAWERQGIMVSQMQELPVARYFGDVFDSNASPIVPTDQNDICAIWTFCSSDKYRAEVRKVDQSLKPTNKSLVQVPFDVEEWRRLSLEQYPAGLPTPYCNDPTQWIFDGHPASAREHLQVGIARLVGYSWPRQIGRAFTDCPTLDADGLEKHGAEDGIICLVAIKGQAPAGERLSALFRDAFGADWSAAKLASLLAEASFGGRTLDDWLRDGCFQQHCELFNQRPFVWHVWDGRRDGFHALINYHRLASTDGEGRRTLEKLIYSYLGDWIDRQRAEQKAGVEGADGRLAAAGHLRSELIKIRDGEPPYDIFIRWKPLHEQPIGWEPDINDGVRINIRPFMTARPLGTRGASACILRTTPKSVKWDKDRGKEPVRDKLDYPWFWTWDETTKDFDGSKEFDGNRWNDLHYSRAVKQTARDRYRTTAGGNA